MTIAWGVCLAINVAAVAINCMAGSYRVASVSLGVAIFNVVMLVASL